MKKSRQAVCSDESLLLKALGMIKVEQMEDEEPLMAPSVHPTSESAPSTLQPRKASLISSQTSWTISPGMTSTITSLLPTS